MTINTDADLLSVGDVARHLGVSVRHVYRLRETGELPVVKIRGRVLIEPAAVDRLIARSRDEASDAPGVDQQIAEIVSMAPILTPAQRRDLAAVLAGGAA